MKDTKPYNQEHLYYLNKFGKLEWTKGTQTAQRSYHGVDKVFIMDKDFRVTDVTTYTEFKKQEDQWIATLNESRPY